MQRSIDYVARLFALLTPAQYERINERLYEEGDEESKNKVVAKIGHNSCILKNFQTLQPNRWLSDEVINFYFQLLGERSKALFVRKGTKRKLLYFNSQFLVKYFNEDNADIKNRGKADYNLVKNWATKKFPHVSDIFEAHKIFIPFNRDKIHWACIVVNMPKKSIQYYDSLMPCPMGTLEKVKSYLEHEYMAKKKKPLPNPEEWQLEDCTGMTPQQNNSK
jgi:Ulp1 family protease